MNYIQLTEIFRDNQSFKVIGTSGYHSLSLP